MDTNTTSSDPLRAAHAIIEQTSVNLFLTGKAGTGKTTFLRALDESTAKRHVVLAPTGVAAINAGGTTIHSFFQLDFAPFIPDRGYSLTADKKKYQRFSRDKLKIIRTLDLIIIDEISMVRPDVLDAMDSVLRRLRNPIKPFGGVQLLLIGDLRQLAPVAQEEEWGYLKEHYASPYFFESHALKEAGFLMLELTKVYRQTDEEFLSILNSIRTNRADARILSRLNRRADPRLVLPGEEDSYIRLTTHNFRANQINSERLARLDSQPFTFRAVIQGDFPESAYPAEQDLTLKAGAKVMFIKNDLSGNHEYYNGLLGHVQSVSDTEVLVKPQDRETPIRVGRVVWERMKYTLGNDGEIKETPEGSFEQIPLRLAWSITIHKSQGLTFDRAIVDASHSFAPGQTYVALSRCRSLEGLVLERPLPPSAIMTDPAVNAFIDGHPKLEGSDTELNTFRESYFAEMLAELFDFRITYDLLNSYFRASAAVLGKDYPRFVDAVSDAMRYFQTDVTDVAAKLFRVFRQGLPRRQEPEVAEVLRRKITGGAAYFAEHLGETLRLVQSTPVNIDNRVLQKRITTAADALFENLTFKITLLTYFKDNDFDPGIYLKQKTRILVSGAGTFNSTQRKGATTGSRKADTAASTADIRHPELYRRLIAWRLEQADGMPAYTVLSNRTIMAIAADMPTDRLALADIPGIGKVKIQRFGEEILDIVRDYVRNYT
ncbi:MAG: AAA family ATPase [Muribaculaceae bacterium]|nr:AAA family ATPase [Muribaculaceae bacterium]